MATDKNKEILKGYFNTGDVPTESNFHDLVDSTINQTDATQQNVTSNLSISGSLITTSITGSGDISSSGTLTVADVEIETSMSVGGTISATGFLISGVPVGTSTSSFWSSGSEETGKIFYTVGNVGIGSSSPSSTLEVIGNVHVSGALGNITASQNISASGYISGSKIISNTGSFKQIDTVTSASIKHISASDASSFNNLTTFTDTSTGAGTGYRTEIDGGVIRIFGGGLDLNVGSILGNSFQHYGDTDTSITFPENGKITLATDGTTLLTLDSAITASADITSSASGSFKDLVATSASFSYITASHLDLDGETMRIGGESFTKTNLSDLKAGKALEGDGEFKGDRIMGNTDPTTYIDFGGSKRRAGKSAGTLGIVSRGRDVFSVERDTFDFGQADTPIIINVQGPSSQYLGSGSFEWTGSAYLIEAPLTITGSDDTIVLDVTGTGSLSGSWETTGSVQVTGSIYITGSDENTTTFGGSGTGSWTGSWSNTGSWVQTGSIILSGSDNDTENTLDGVGTGSWSGSWETTGSVLVSGSLDITGSIIITGSIQISSSDEVTSGSDAGTTFVADECEISTINFDNTNNAFITSSLTASVFLHGQGRINHVRSGSTPTVSNGWGNGTSIFAGALPVNNGGFPMDVNNGAAGFFEPVVLGAAGHPWYPTAGGKTNQLDVRLPECEIGMSFTFRNAHLTELYSSVDTADRNNCNWSVQPAPGDRFVLNSTGSQGVNGKAIVQESGSAQTGDYICLTAIQSMSVNIESLQLTASAVWSINTLVGTWHDQL